MIGFCGGFFVCLSCYWVLAKIIIYFIIYDKGGLEDADRASEESDCTGILAALDNDCPQ